MLRLGATRVAQVKQVAPGAPNENPSPRPVRPGVTPQLLYMTCRAFMRRNGDLPGFRYTSLCPCADARALNGCPSPISDRHPSATVTLRCPSEARASKGDGPYVATSLGAAHPSRLATLAPQDDGRGMVAPSPLTVWHSSDPHSLPSHHLPLLPSSHHLSFPRGVGRADRLISLCRPPNEGGGGAPQGAHWVIDHAGEARYRVTTRGDPVATGTAPLGAPPWRFPAAGPRFNSGSVHRIHAATCPPARSQDLTDWVPYLPRRDSHPLATGRHASLRL